jgi:hypothetical protein
MALRTVGPVFFLLLLAQLRLYSQHADSLFDLHALVYDETYMPVSATHVINMNTRQGTITDTLGIFHIEAHPSDTLMIRNIMFRDTLVSAVSLREEGYVRLTRRFYELEEARIFRWGSTYDDFQEAFVGMPMAQTLGASMGLPRQDPDYVPLEMNEKAVKSAGLLLTSPISFFYYNFSRQAKSERKVYWLKRYQEKQELFDTLVGPENLSEITGLTGQELRDFMYFLSQRMQCGIHCSELDIYSEIYALWDLYQELMERGMLEP